ncbi:MAG: gamma-glutamylcyclotransferase [Chitinophagales bacterium]|nr:gamma-glutamylcyclotransferase [Chitinophagales bacterium]
MSEYLFTYGTLRAKRDDGIAKYLAENSTLVDLGKLVGAQIYTINWYPGLIKTNDKSHVVYGDIFMIHNQDEVFKKLDEYEGIDIGLKPFEYKRELVEIISTKQNVMCWAYFYNWDLPKNAKLINSGDFLNP